MKTRIGLSFALAVVIFSLFGCFSQWRGDEGTFSVSFGGGSGRAAIGWNDPIYWLDDHSPSELLHVITLSGPDQEIITPYLEGAQTVNFSVTPGVWDILVEAYLEEKGDVMARGFAKNKEIKPGSNGVIHITMGPLEDKEPSVTETVYVNIEIWYGDKNVTPTTNTNGVLTISKTVRTDKENDFTATVAGADTDTNVEWYVLGALVMKGEDSITIEAADYNTGTYTLTVVAWIDGKPYSSDEITFTVND